MRNEPPKKELEESGPDLAHAAYVAAAIAEVALVKTPEKKEKEKDPKDWKTWAEGMRQGALELADAAKAKKPADVKKAAEKMDNNCKSCHKIFRDE